MKGLTGIAEKCKSHRFKNVYSKIKNSIATKLPTIRYMCSIIIM